MEQWPASPCSTRWSTSSAESKRGKGVQFAAFWKTIDALWLSYGDYSSCIWGFMENIKNAPAAKPSKEGQHFMIQGASTKPIIDITMDSCDV